jgi:hypothetical protein
MANGFDRTVAAARRIQSISSSGGSGSFTDNHHRDGVWKIRVFQYAFLKAVFGLDDLTSTEVERAGPHTHVLFNPPFDQRRNEFIKIGTSIGGSTPKR